MGRAKKKPNKKTGSNKGFVLPVLSFVLALIVGLLGLVEFIYYRNIRDNCSSEISGIVDYEGYGRLTDKSGTVEGRYLSTGKSARYWIRIVVNTDGVFRIKTLYAGTGYGDEGDEVTISYNPADPDEYYIGDYDRETRAAAIVLFVISGLLFALSIFFTVILNVKKDTQKNVKTGNKKKAETDPKERRKQEERDNEARRKRAEERAKIYTRNYTNERIRDQIWNNSTCFIGITVITLFGCFLILSSFVRTCIDVYTDHQIPFNDFPKTIDDYFYSIEITERPMPVSGQFYDLTTGDQHILALHLYAKKLRSQDYPVTLRGKIKRIRVSDEDTRNAVKDYYEKIGYLDSLEKEEYAYYYLDCEKVNLWNELRENHVLGLVFGITILIVMGVGIREFGSLYMFKHFFPACSGRRYKAKEIDDLANHPDTRWLDDANVFVTPGSFIGLNHGITVVDFDDITGIKVKEKEHSERRNRVSRGRVGLFGALYYASTDKYKKWITYVIIVETKKHRKMVLTETACKDAYMSLQAVLDKRNNKDEG